MKILKDGKEHWLTTLDIAFLTLFTLHMLVEECWKRHILLIGITKDTAARDFKRQLIPIMHDEALLKTTIPREEFEKLLKKFNEKYPFIKVTTNFGYKGGFYLIITSSYFFNHSPLYEGI